ncbi:MAG: hypothetical protein J5526_04180 [Bacteroidales bacterium]|nr:hypothetical protein [Bacteroidales bacterium]
MRKQMLLYIFLTITLLANAQHSGVANFIELSVRSELQSRFENGWLSDTTYIMLDMWNVDASNFSDVQPPQGKAVWMSLRDLDYEIINKEIPFLHVSINIEDGDIAVYLQSGLGVRYDGSCKCYRYPLATRIEDGVTGNIWSDILKVYLTSSEGRSCYPEVLPVVFGKYKYCYQIERMGFPSSVNGVAIKALSEFVKPDGSFYIDFEDDFMGIPFIVTDISYNQDNNILVYLRNVVLSDGYVYIANGIYPHVGYSVFELSFDESYGFRIMSYSLDQKSELK